MRYNDDPMNPDIEPNVQTPANATVPANDVNDAPANPAADSTPATEAPASTEPAAEAAPEAEQPKAEEAVVSSSFAFDESFQDAFQLLVRIAVPTLWEEGRTIFRNPAIKSQNAVQPPALLWTF